MSKRPKMRGYINLKKVNKEMLVTTEKGIWLNLAVWQSDYENTDYDISQNPSKEQREAGMKGKGIGSLNINLAQSGGSKQYDEPTPDDKDDLPF